MQSAQQHHLADMYQYANKTIFMNELGLKHYDPTDNN